MDKHETNGNDREVTGEVAGEVTGTVTGRINPEKTPAEGSQAPAMEAAGRGTPAEGEYAPNQEPLDASSRAQDDRRLDLTEQRDTGIRENEAEDGRAEPEREMTEEERELAKPVAAVPPGVDLETVEPAEGFRLPRDQTEAQAAREQGEAEYLDASRPEVAQRLADEAREAADEAAAEAERAQQRADEVKASYEGPERPPLHEGWRYLAPEPDPHDPA